MHFRKDKLFGRHVVFSGNISSGSEERYITGTIYDLWNKVFLKDCVVMRIGVPIEEDGIILTILFFTVLNFSSSIFSLTKPGPSLLYILIIQFSRFHLVN